MKNDFDIWFKVKYSLSNPDQIMHVITGFTKNH